MNQPEAKRQAILPALERCALKSRWVYLSCQIVVTLLSVAIAFPLLKACAQTPEQAQYDIVILNGHVIDGTGNPWYAADIAINGDHIATIGDLHDAHARRVIEAKGRIVAPGFIDMLGQSEFSLLLDNRSVSKLSQGINVWRSTATASD